MLKSSGPICVICPVHSCDPVLFAPAGRLPASPFLFETQPEALSLQLSTPILESLLLSMEIHMGQMFLANHWAVANLEGGVSARV